MMLTCNVSNTVIEIVIIIIIQSGRKIKRIDSIVANVWSLDTVYNIDRK